MQAISRIIMRKFKLLFLFSVVSAVIGIILITLGLFMPYQTTIELNFYYHYERENEYYTYRTHYQGEQYYYAVGPHIIVYEPLMGSYFSVPTLNSWFFEGSKLYTITLIDYKTPDDWKGNASDSKIFFGLFEETLQKVIPLTTPYTFELNFDRDKTLGIALATNLSYDEIKEQGYLGGWILTFTIEFPTQGNYDLVFVGVVFLVAGSIVLIILLYQSVEEPKRPQSVQFLRGS